MRTRILLRLRGLTRRTTSCTFAYLVLYSMSIASVPWQKFQIRIRSILNTINEWLVERRNFVTFRSLSAFLS